MEWQARKRQDWMGIARLGMAGNECPQSRQALRALQQDSIFNQVATGGNREPLDNHRSSYDFKYNPVAHLPTAK